MPSHNSEFESKWIIVCFSNSGAETAIKFTPMLKYLFANDRASANRHCRCGKGAAIVALRLIAAHSVGERLILRCSGQFPHQPASAIGATVTAPNDGGDHPARTPDCCGLGSGPFPH